MTAQSIGLNDSVALVQSVDFFPPIVDDPYWFGAIAAANALSDIYAMGATPLIGLNIVCFPIGLPKEVLAQHPKGRGGQDDGGGSYHRRGAYHRRCRSRSTGWQ